MRPDYWCYPSPRGTTALTRPLFTVWPSRVPASGVEARASARLPCWRDIRIAGIGGVSMAFRTATSRRAGARNPRDARGAARGGTRDGPAGSGAGRYAGPGRRARRQPGSGLGRHHNSRLAGRRAACLPSSAMAPRDFRKPPNPGRLTAAISSPAAPAVPRNSFSRRPSLRDRRRYQPDP
jgi:hypothetical protein